MTLTTLSQSDLGTVEWLDSELKTVDDKVVVLQVVS